MKPSSSILIIDDCKTHLLVTKVILTKSLHFTNISMVNSGEEGLQWIEDFYKTSAENLLIFLDIKMPEMDGFAFLEAFHLLDESIKDKIQILMLSSTLDTEDITRAANNVYVTALLTKPLSVTELRKYIDLE